MGADNSMIERLRGVMIIDRAAECESNGSHAAGRAAPQIHADQGLRLEPPGRLFADFANDRSQQCFTVLDVSGGLIEDQALIDALLDDEKAAIGFPDRGDFNFGLLSGRASGPARNYSNQPP